MSTIGTALLLLASLLILQGSTGSLWGSDHTNEGYYPGYLSGALVPLSGSTSVSTEETSSGYLPDIFSVPLTIITFPFKLIKFVFDVIIFPVKLFWSFIKILMFPILLIFNPVGTVGRMVGYY